MQLFDPNNPNEKKKLIAAGVLGVVAIGVLGYVLFGGSGSPKPPANVSVRSSPTPLARGPNFEPPTDDQTVYKEVVYHNTAPAVAEGNRNIFAYYEPPPVTPKPAFIPTPTPAPTPPLIATAVSPSTVYAQTAEFRLQLSGDKFTPAVQIVIDGRSLPTRFVNAQQLATTVPASVIATAGSRQVTARSNDGQLFSNAISLNVAQPPTPNFTYVGLIGKPRFNDTAVLQDKSSKEFINVRRGENLGGRFRVVSISEKEVVVTDTTLKINHKLPFTSESGTSPYRAPIRQTSSDEPM
jgi:hypothetical protein